jgi:DNA-directed RNA polymerase specialized sigma24 family protein
MRDVAEPFRSALVLKEIAGMSVDDVAMVLGVKAATVKTASTPVAAPSQRPA